MSQRRPCQPECRNQSRAAHMSGSQQAFAPSEPAPQARGEKLPGTPSSIGRPRCPSRAMSLIWCSRRWFRGCVKGGSGVVGRWGGGVGVGVGVGGFEFDELGNAWNPTLCDTNGVFLDSYGNQEPWYHGYFGTCSTLSPQTSLP